MNYEREILYRFSQYSKIIKINNTSLLSNKILDDKSSDRNIYMFFAEKDFETVVIGVFEKRCFRTEYYLMEYKMDEDEEMSEFDGWYYVGSLEDDD